MIKRLSCLVLAVLLSCVVSFSLGEGLLPSLDDAYGVSMPSLGSVLHRYPDSEMTDQDGNSIQNWSNVRETEFEAFSEYLGGTGAELQDYKVDGDVFTATIGRDGKGFTFAYNQKEESAVVTYPQGTYDERDYAAESHYNKAKEYMEGEQYAEALEEYRLIEEYDLFRDVDQILKTDKNLIAAATAAAYEEKIAPFKKLGNIVTFGHYEQDNDMSNGPEEIEWIVLDNNENEHKVLLLSRYGLEVEETCVETGEYTWEGSDVRKWLNDEFYKSAFTEAEKEAVLTTLVDNSISQCYSDSEYGGNNTKDRIFVLSYAEGHKYLGLGYKNTDKGNDTCDPTEYANTHYLERRDKSNTYYSDTVGYWWVRNASYDRESAAYVSDSYYSNYANFGLSLIRPAMWIDLASNYFSE